MENKWLIALGIFVFVFILYRIMHGRRDNSVSKEIDEIINSDKHKVKGQYD